MYSYKNFTQLNININININNNKKNIHHFIHNIYNLYITFLVFTEKNYQEVFFTIGFYDFYEIMTRSRGEEHLHNIFFFFFF